MIENKIVINGKQPKEFMIVNGRSPKELMLFNEKVRIESNCKCIIFKVSKLHKKIKCKNKITKESNDNIKLSKNGHYILIYKIDGKTKLIEFSIEIKNKKTILLLILLLWFILMFLSNFLSRRLINPKASNSDLVSKNDVAIWEFNLNGNGINYKEINFADTIKENKKNNLIYPGKSGTIELIIDSNKSDVDLEYLLEVNKEVNKPRNLYYQINGNIYSNIKELAEKEINGEIYFRDENKKRSYIIEWNWPFENANNNIFDEEDGKKANQYNLNFSVIGKQIINN